LKETEYLSNKEQENLKRGGEGRRTKRRREASVISNETALRKQNSLGKQEDPSLPFEPWILLAVSAGSVTTLDAGISHKQRRMMIAEC
jgi:hypothetical protein